MQDLSVPIDASQQSTLTAWALKTAMVFDSVNTRDRSLFYTRSERENLRLSSTIPEVTDPQSSNLEKVSGTAETT